MLTLGVVEVFLLGIGSRQLIWGGKGQTFQQAVNEWTAKDSRVDGHPKTNSGMFEMDQSVGKCQETLASTADGLLD